MAEAALATFPSFGNLLYRPGSVPGNTPDGLNDWELGVLFLFFTLVMTWIVLTAFLWLGSHWIQGWFYSEPTTGLHWRATSAGSALALFVVLWCLIIYRAPDRFETIPLLFTGYDVKEVPELLSEKKGKTSRYVGRKTGPQAHYEYHLKEDPGVLWRREDAEGIVEAIIIEEGGQKCRFMAETTKDGKFKTPAPGFPVYREKGGKRRVMEQLGRITTVRQGIWWANIFLNVFHMALWFVSLWLLLRFQWSHALGLTVALWLGMTLVVLPTLLAKAQALGRPLGS